MAMMTPSEFGDALPVDGYGPGFFRVGGQIYRQALVVTGAGLTPWGGLDDRAPLMALAGQIDVLFLGMGAEVAFPPRDLVDALEARGVMVEPMSTPSAARSYNVTLSEGRRVGCALLLL